MYFRLLLHNLFPKLIKNIFIEIITKHNFFLMSSVVTSWAIHYQTNVLAEIVWVHLELYIYIIRLEEQKLDFYLFLFFSNILFKLTAKS